MTATAGRFPLVSRDEILLAYRPGAEPSEGAFRTLRRRKLVSHGIGLRVRHKNRLAGQVRVYSILNLDCAVLARRGKIEQARRIASRAGRQEARWEPRLEKLLSSIGVETFEKLQQLRKEFAHAFLPLAQEAERLRHHPAWLARWPRLRKACRPVVFLRPSSRLFRPHLFRCGVTIFSLYCLQGLRLAAPGLNLHRCQLLCL